jgi:hypothetical protein
MQDIHASPAYRAHLIVEMARRAVAACEGHLQQIKSQKAGATGFLFARIARSAAGQNM